GPLLSSTDQAGVGRQDQGAGGVIRRTRAVSEWGAIVGQSVGDHLVLASKLKLVRAGSLETGGPETGHDAIEAAADADVPRTIRAAVDIGVMAASRHARLGLTIKNLNEPKFGDDPDALRLHRQARVGVALLADRVGPLQRFILAADADLTKTSTVV